MTHERAGFSTMHGHSDGQTADADIREMGELLDQLAASDASGWTADRAASLASETMPVPDVAVIGRVDASGARVSTWYRQRGFFGSIAGVAAAAAVLICGALFLPSASQNESSDDLVAFDTTRTAVDTDRLAMALESWFDESLPQIGSDGFAIEPAPSLLDDSEGVGLEIDAESFWLFDASLFDEGTM